MARGSSGEKPVLTDEKVTPGAIDALALARSAVQSLCRTDRASQNLGIEILEVTPGYVRISMTVRPDMVNGHGLCHGGIIFTLADSAFAFACNSHGQAMVALFRGRCARLRLPTPNGTSS